MTTSTKPQPRTDLMDITAGDDLARLGRTLAVEARLPVPAAPRTEDHLRSLIGVLAGLLEDHDRATRAVLA